MSASHNRVTVVGVCGKYGFTMKYLPSGAAVASGSITIAEPCKDGRVFETFYPVEVYGSKAEAAAALEPRVPILIDGRLAKRKAKTGEWEVCVACFHAQPLGTAQPPAVAPTVAEDEDIPF